MKLISLIACLSQICFSCQNTFQKNTAENKTEDSLYLIKMVHIREAAMKEKDIKTVMTQFAGDATFINSAGSYCANKAEITNFHQRLTESDSIGYHYKAGNVKVRILDKDNALVYYPWRMDWYWTENKNDTIEKEVGLMTLSAQKRNGAWLWIAITNQHTPEYFDDLYTHKR
jgi:uncharacterized protein (TIGR02246 family)